MEVVFQFEKWLFQQEVGKQTDPHHAEEIKGERIQDSERVSHQKQIVPDVEAVRENSNESERPPI